MKNAFLWLLLGWLASFPTIGHTQKSYLAINSVHLPKPIADNNIQMALQDQAGLLWFVTENGLYRYDGTELLHFGIGTTPALPSLAITALSTDNQGNLWIGFNQGAARFDLKRWTITPLYSKNWQLMSPHDKRITAVTCTRDGAVYFGAQSGKLFIVHSDSLMQMADLGAGRRKFKPTGPPLDEPSIKNIQEPVDGQLWLATGDGMLVCMDKAHMAGGKPALYNFPLIKGLSITNICYDRTGKCIFSVDNIGVFLTDIKKLYKERDIFRRSATGTLNATAIGSWSSSSGISSSNCLNNEFSDLVQAVPLPDSVEEGYYPLIFYVPGGKAGILSMNKDLTRHVYSYDFTTEQWLRNPQSYIAKYPGEIVHSISSSRSAQVAYINSAGGLSAIRARSLPFDMRLNSEDNINSIRAIYGEGDNLYIGSYQQYFLRFNKTTGNITPLQTLYVYKILPWSKDTLLIGSEGAGLLWYEIAKNKLTNIGNNLKLTRPASVYQSKFITALERVNSHQVLEGTTRGIHLVDPFNKKLDPVFSNPTALNMQAVKINTIAPYPIYYQTSPGHNATNSPTNGPTNSKYLVGTEAGAFITDAQNGQTRYLLGSNTPPEIRQSNVHCLLTFNHQIWIGTTGLGMLAVDSLNNLHYMEWLNAKLSGHTIYSMQQSGSFILIGTNKGLSMVDLRDSSVVTYQATDGMHSDEFNQSAVFAAGSEVFMGTLNGIIWLNKNKAVTRKGSRPFSIHINKFTIAGNNNDIKTYYHMAYLSPDALGIQIPANTRYFSLTFDNPADQDKNLPYYYRLGPKQSWVNLGSRREITFNKMEPGTYQLQLTRNIKAKNGQASIFQIPITVLPAYYQTTWFKILILLIITAIIILIIKYRQRQLDKERNLRTKIAGDLHDEIGSSLTRIWHQAQRIRLGDFNRTPSDSRLADQKKLQHIAATSQEAIAMLSDMVWSIDAQFDTLDELLVRMRTYVYQLQNDYDIAIKMVSGNVAKDRKVSQIVRQNLLLLFKEAINNAIKYGDGALINITIDMDTRIKMEITNTFDEQTKKTSAIGGRGLENMQRRVNKMHGELKIDRHDNLFRLVIIV